MAIDSDVLFRDAGLLRGRPARRPGVGRAATTVTSGRSSSSATRASSTAIRSGPRSRCRSGTGRSRRCRRGDGRRRTPGRSGWSSRSRACSSSCRSSRRGGSSPRVRPVSPRSVEREAELSRLSWRLEFALAASNVGVWDVDLATDHLLWDERVPRAVRLSRSPGLPQRGGLDRRHPPRRPGACARRRPARRPRGMAGSSRSIASSGRTARSGTSATSPATTSTPRACRGWSG